MIRCFYAPPTLVRDGLITLKDEEFHHAYKVLRKRVGDRIKVVDGLGTVYDAFISSIDKRRKEIRAKVKKKEKEEERGQLGVGCPILRKERMDFLIEKGTELGVTEFIPLITKRTQRKPERAKERWEKIAISAIKQCRRATLPKIRPPIILNEIGKVTDSYSTKFVLDPYAEDKLESSKLREKIFVLLGPEGGLEEEEITFLKRIGFSPISLGERILRTETALLVALSIIGHLRGEF